MAPSGTVFLSVSGCGVVPSVNILGSFFPAWLISIVTGVVLTVLTRQAFLIARLLRMCARQQSRTGV